MYELEYWHPSKNMWVSYGAGLSTFEAACGATFNADLPVRYRLEGTEKWIEGAGMTILRELLKK